METVKVDMQKLQLLNDRIAQTIDALNQLRLSVHGIQHTPQAFGAWGQTGYPYGSYGQFSPYGVYNPLAYGQPSFGQPTFGQPYNTPFVPGIQHTSPIGTPSWVMPFTPNGLSHTTSQTWPQTWQTSPTYPVTIY